jgi:nifR3 family TIM-barrel protein
MGCPVPKIVKNGEGSALMREPLLVYNIISACVRALDSSGTNVPLTVKIRAGWNNNRNADEIAKIAEAAGAAMICVHGRTREAMYAPPVDLDIIKTVKESVSIPVIGNGDIRSADDALRMIVYTGCDGVAIGRGALGNPWIFEEIRAAMSGVPYEQPTAMQRAEVALRHLDLMIKLKGSRTAMLEARRHLCYYIRGGHGSAALRAAIMKSSDFDEMRALILEFAKNR